MRRHITLAAGVVVLLMGTLTMASSAEAKTFKRSYSGWGEATEIDTNGDGRRADSSTTGSEGTFGPAISHSQAELGPPSAFCDGKVLWVRLRCLDQHHPPER
jgi:hypothetical protein